MGEGINLFIFPAFKKTFPYVEYTSSEFISFTKYSVKNWIV